MSYQHLFTEKYNEYNLGETIHLGDVFDNFFDALHHTIKAKEKLSSYFGHSIVDLQTNKVICVLREI